MEDWGEREGMEDCGAKDRRVSDVTRKWSTAALDSGAWYNTVCEGGYSFMVAWVRKEKKASENRQGKRKAEEADKIEVAPGVNMGS